MSSANQECKNCGRDRDYNNNFMPYMSGYSVNQNNKNNNSQQTNNNNLNMQQVSAKVMWGTVGAIKELREKEQAEKSGGARATGRRQ